MAGEEREALAKIGDRLCAELGYPPPADLPAGGGLGRAPGNPRPFAEALSPEDELLVAVAHRSLIRLATGLVAKHPPGSFDKGLRAMLDGSELLMRSELAAGNSILSLMPSFVYLIALPMLNQDEAVALSRRASSLLEEALG